MLVQGPPTLSALFAPTVGSWLDAVMPLSRSLAAFSIVSGRSPDSRRVSK
jgi:hypothetical protein